MNFQPQKFVLGYISPTWNLYVALLLFLGI